jgi:integrase
MSKPLTALAIANLKPSGQRREVSDGQIQGLRLVIQATGAMSWAMRYRFASRPRKLTIGPWPAIDLKSARTIAQKAHVDLAAGIDPGAVKQAKKAEARKPKADSVEIVFADFVRLHAKPNTRSWKETERILREFSTAWQGRTLASITRADIHRVLDGILARGAPIAANRSFAATRKAFAWSVSRGLIETSPCAGIVMPSAAKSRDRVLGDDELASIWRAADALGFPYGPIVKLLILTGQRRAEIAGMRWDEIDLPNRIWIIPAARAKNGRKHEVPLSSQAIEVIESLSRFTSDLLFGPSGKAPSGYSEAKARIDKALPPDMPPWVFHDIRRSVASGMAAGGTDLHVIERCLNHISGSFGGIVSVYQKHNFAGQMRTAFDAWARHVEALASGEVAGNVVELSSVRA